MNQSVFSTAPLRSNEVTKKETLISFETDTTTVPSENDHAVADVQHIEAPLNKRIDVIENRSRVQLPAAWVLLVVRFDHQVVDLLVFLAAVYALAEFAERLLRLTLEEIVELYVVLAQNYDLVAESLEEIGDARL